MTPRVRTRILIAHRVLVCLHDLTLESTTDVARVFPGRFHRRWYVSAC